MDHRWQPLDPLLLQYLDVNSEANFPMWVNAVLLLGVAILAAAAALLDEPRSRPAWWLIVGAGAYLSMDEAAGVHEQLAYLMEGPGGVPFLWLIPGVVLAAVGATTLVMVGRRLPRRPGLRLAGALGLYLGAAIGVEVVNAAQWLSSGESQGYQLGTFLEEGLEMVACVLAIGIIAGHLRNLAVVRRHGGLAGAVRAELPPAAPRLLAVLAVAGWLLWCVVAITVLVAITSPGRHPVENLFDIRRESSVPTWWQLMLLFLVAVACALTAAVTTAPDERKAWTAAAVAAALFSLSEGSALHEKLGVLTSIDVPEQRLNDWVPPGALLAVVAVALLSWFCRALPEPARRMLAAAVAALLLGAVAGQALTNWLVWQGQTMAAMAASLAAETLEVAGAALASYAVLSQLVAGRQT